MNDKMARSVLRTNLEILLDSKGWTVSDLQRATKDPMMTLHNIVNGRNLPRAGILLRIAKAFGVTIDDLFDTDLAKKLPIRV